MVGTSPSISSSTRRRTRSSWPRWPGRPGH